MGEKSKIEWTDATFNPWIGCTKVSAGCKFCYAERDNDYRRWNPAGWGPQADRKRTSIANWRKPLQWNREAEKTGERRRVFCASLADIFDEHLSILPEWRADLFGLIEQTPSLDWLLLTKRPENVLRIVEEYTPDAETWFRRNPHAWIGTSVEDQLNADKRIPELLKIPAHARFLSAEPLLGSMRITAYLREHTYNARYDDYDIGEKTLDWVIVGGESGRSARPMHPDWARSLRDQCRSAGVAFHFKQWGEWALKSKQSGVNVGDNWGVLDPDGTWYAQHTGWNGRDIDPDTREAFMVKVGKKNAGRLLDGREWNEFPAP